MDNNPLIIGIAGRSCSGKTRLAANLHKMLGHNKSIHIDVDKFLVWDAEFNCKDPGDLELEGIKELKTGLSKLKNGQKATFTVLDYKRKYKPARHPIIHNSEGIIILDGTLIYWDKNVRDLIDIKVFVDVPNDVCLKRRLKRQLDSKQKGTREYENAKKGTLNRWNIISNQWDNYLEPTKKYADVVVPHPEKGEKRVLDYIANMKKTVS